VLSYLRIRKCRSPGRRFRMLEWPSHRLLRSERPCSRAYLTSRRPREKCAPRELPTGPRLSLFSSGRHGSLLGVTCCGRRGGCRFDKKFPRVCAIELPHADGGYERRVEVA
jgi:hypothetical protein